MATAGEREPRVAIIVAAYNYGRFLRDALDSVLRQTFSDWQCAIVDDGSTDDTAEVAAEYVRRDARFLYIRQENRGPSAARNLGIRSTAGEFLQFLDADDRLHERKLEEHVRFMEQHPETDIVYSEIMYFRSEDPGRMLHSLGGKLSRSILQRVHGNGEALQKLELYNFIPNPGGALTRRRVLERAGMFDEESRGGEDYAFWLQCAVAGCDFQYFDLPGGLTFVRVHGQSASQSQELLVRGQIRIAHGLRGTPAFRWWTRDRLPLLFEVALGIEEAEHGFRFRAFRRIARAASDATEGLTAARWWIYALAALLLPRFLFTKVVMRRIPEGPFELYRRVRSMMKRRSGPE